MLDKHWEENLTVEEKLMDVLHNLWNELLTHCDVWDNLLEIPGRASEDVMDPLLVFFFNMEGVMATGYERDPYIIREKVRF